jgi:GTPase SAR1 family protein
MRTLFKESLSRISDIINRQSEIISVVGSVSVSYKHYLSILKQIQETLTDYKLKVVVLGKYGSGKSSLINALLGQKFLPVNPLPTYDMVVEIQYSDKPNATLYPTNNSGKEPFDVRIEDLKKYIFFDREEMNDDVKKAIAYEKIVLRYPIDNYKQDVVITEIPEVSDNLISHECLLSADIIIYCMNSQSPFGTIDKNTIEHLRALGLTSIFFVLTFFDTVEYWDLMIGNHDAEDTRRHYTNILSPYTDFDSEGILFVGSIPALMGKIKNDTSLLESSHFPEMERKLDQMINERIRLKLIKAVDSVGKVNREIRRYLSNKIELYKQDKTSIIEKLNSAQVYLERAKEKAKMISPLWNICASEIVSGTEDRFRLFFLSEILPNVESWVQECNPMQGISLWNPKRTGTDYTESCMKCLQAKMEIEMCMWSREELVPQVFSKNLIICLEHLKPIMDEYESNLNSLNNVLSLKQNNSQVYGIRRINQAMSEVVGGDINWSICTPVPIPVNYYFPKLPSILNSIYVVVLKNVFEKISDDVTIIALSSLMGGCLGDEPIERRLKRTIGRKAKAQLAMNVNIAISEIRNRVEIITNKILRSIENNLNTHIDQYQKLIKDVKEVDLIEEQMATNLVMLTKNNSISDELGLMVTKHIECKQ